MLAALVVLAGTVPVAAQADGESEGVLGDLLADGDDEIGLVDAVLAFAAGVRARVSDLLDGVGNEWSAEDAADDVAAFYNDHNASFEAWANDRATATTDDDVLELTFVGPDDRETRYLVADVNATADEWANSSVVESTDREVDHWLRLCGPAARNAPDELNEFHDEFVEDGDDVSEGYTRRLAGRYAGNVRSDLLGHDAEEC